MSISLDTFVEITAERIRCGEGWWGEDSRAAIVLRDFEEKYVLRGEESTAKSINSWESEFRSAYRKALADWGAEAERRRIAGEKRSERAAEVAPKIVSFSYGGRGRMGTFSVVKDSENHIFVYRICSPSGRSGSTVEGLGVLVGVGYLSSRGEILFDSAGYYLSEPFSDPNDPSDETEEEEASADRFYEILSGLEKQFRA